MFKRILIANRGEIAVRIARAARELNIDTIAIYHSIDKEMPFVQYCDYAYKLEGESPKEAYLDINQIIDIAKKSHCDAIHPGYGFLSENADFAKAVEDSKIVFIGPKSKSIEMMGSKTGAREIMARANVPIVPGTKEPLQSIEDALSIADEIGYPVLLKASAGGGGKGMKKVENHSELADAFNSAKREALKAFADDSIYIEKYFENSKHIEFQIFADTHGNYVHLGERDCSIQRRHQKIIEEAPSTVLDEALRMKMGKVAIDAAKACDYVNAGTIEFLLDKNKNFYFLEMNTRLQVEHPVTEMVTGFDLAKEQIRVAEGHPLSFSQEDVKINGYAIECRIYAEDSFNNFMPDIGKITYLRQPDGFGVRVDSGIENGTEVSMHFDPMLAKLITWGRDRSDAISRMESALKNYRVNGVKTIIPFLLAVIRHHEFKYGYFDTGFIQHAFDFSSLDLIQQKNEEIVAAIAAFGYQMTNDTNRKSNTSQSKNTTSKWKEKNLYLKRNI